MRMVSVLACLWLLASPAAAQNVGPALLAQSEGKPLPMTLKRLRVEVRIVGSLAETTSTMTFANPTARVLEGDLYFPLPEGAAISGYALDVAGQLVDGVAVEKHEARRVYEEIVRRGIDPGLAQWTAGNHFQTRVFPLPARGERTVRVRYASELADDGGAPAYHLPLRFREAISEFALRIEVVKPRAAPTVAKGGPAKLGFDKWRESFVAETTQTNWKPTEDLIVALPPTDGPQTLVERADDGQCYFAVQCRPKRPTQTPVAAKASRVVILWDASGSRAGDHRREIDLLGKCVDGLHAERLELVLLRNTAGKPQQFTSVDALAKVLAAVDYDGGTQLGAIRPAAKGAAPDVYLLFTDGISNFGRDEPGRLDAPLYVFSADAGASHPLLHALAAANGGQYFNLAQWKDSDVVAQLGRPPWLFLSAQLDGKASPDLYPNTPQLLSGRFTLVGKLPADAAQVEIRCGLAAKETSRDRFAVRRADAVSGGLLQRVWAQKRLAGLMLRQRENQAQITALGKRFGLVTPYTSLLVLDSVEQYVQYEIAPPDSLPAMRDEYNRRIDTLEHQRRKQKADKLAEVVRMWNERVKWWQTEFKVKPGFRYRETGSKFGLGMGGGMGGMAAPAAAAPMPSVMPHPAAMEERRSAGRPLEEAAKAKEPGESAPQPTIAIKPWEPNSPYVKELRKAAEKDVWAVYMRNRAAFGASPAFFLDCADFFREHKRPDLALQSLSNIAELELEEAALLRVLGHRLRQIGQFDLAVRTFERVLALRPEEPQSSRDLALALVARGDNARAAKNAKPQAGRADYARALELFARIVRERWDGRFPEVELFALEEANHLIPRAKEAGITAMPLDPRFVKLLDLDVRIVMTWHADNTDLDLWVVEPTGEKAYFGHNRTTIGGLVSRDFTQGYGPEEYLLHRSAPGAYSIQTNYFGSRATRLLGAVTLQVDVFTDYGRPKEQCKSLTVRLKEAKETITIGEIKF